MYKDIFRGQFKRRPTLHMFGKRAHLFNSRIDHEAAEVDLINAITNFECNVGSLSGGDWEDELRKKLMSRDENERAADNLQLEALFDSAVRVFETNTKLQIYDWNDHGVLSLMIMRLAVIYNLDLSKYSPQLFDLARKVTLISDKNK